ncbi:MAG TPA: alpha/beta fold hydrolase, partial [Terriglobales bacterium]|nr:alpha/beta fold hydrolase [Terriglobales bacterium]
MTHRKTSKVATLLLVLSAGASSLSAAEKGLAPSESSRVTCRTEKVDGLKIFYREAGPKDAPTIVLLHGFPSSSHMFRNLIPALSDKYHVVAPDYPGFGYSDAPPAE